MESKRSDRLEDEIEEILDKMNKLLEHQGNHERIFKLDKKLHSSV